MAKMVMKKLKEEVEGEGLKLSVTENGKNKMIASCGFLENEQRHYSEDEGVTMADNVETKVKRLGAKEQARRRKCKVKFSIIKKNKASQMSYMKVGVKKLGMMPARTVGQMAAAAGKKSTNLFVLVHGSVWLGRGGGTFHIGHPVLGRRSLDGKKWYHQQREAFQEVQTWRQVRGPAGAVMCETLELV